MLSWVGLGEGHSWLQLFTLGLVRALREACRLEPFSFLLLLLPLLLSLLFCSFAKCASRASNYFINHLGTVVSVVVARRLLLDACCLLLGEPPRLAGWLAVSWLFFYGAVPTSGWCSNSENAFNVCLV